MMWIIVGNRTILSIAANTEVTFCAQRLEERSLEGDEELNGFGLLLIRQRFVGCQWVNMHQLTSCWLLFTPAEDFSHCRSKDRYDKLRFEQHDVTLAFGALISSNRFKCAASEYLFQSHDTTPWTVFFARWDAFVTIGTGRSEFTIKPEHIDVGRGMVIDVSSNDRISIYISLRGSVDHYTLPEKRKGKLSAKIGEENTTCTVCIDCLTNRARLFALLSRVRVLPTTRSNDIDLFASLSLFHQEGHVNSIGNETAKKHGNPVCQHCICRFNISTASRGRSIRPCAI
jgi:hypothetical protein